MSELQIKEEERNALERRNHAGESVQMKMQYKWQIEGLWNQSSFFSTLNKQTLCNTIVITIAQHTQIAQWTAHSICSIAWRCSQRMTEEFQKLNIYWRDWQHTHNTSMADLLHSNIEWNWCTAARKNKFLHEPIVCYEYGRESCTLGDEISFDKQYTLGIWLGLAWYPT